MIKLPNQVIPESKKGSEHIEKTVMAVVRGCLGSAGMKRTDYEAWALYAEHFNAQEFDYLRKIGKYTLPAQFRWIGVQRPRINLLASQESKRPWVFSLRVGNNQAKILKIENRINDFLNTLIQSIEQNKLQVQAQIMAMQSQVQQIEQVLQSEPKSEEEAQQIEMIRQQLPTIKMEVAKHVKNLTRTLSFKDKQLDELLVYYNMTWQDEKELYAQILANKMRTRLNLKSKKIEGLIAKCVTGKPIYYVDYKKGSALPTFENIDDVRVYYPRIASIDWIQDGPWVAIEENYSLDMLLHLIKDEITPDEIKTLEEHTNYSHGEDTSGRTKRDLTLGSNLLYDGTEDNTTAIKCMKVFFKSPRKVFIKYSPNPYKEREYFKTFITEEESLKVKTAKGEKAEVRYVTDIYEGLYVQPLNKVFRKKKKEYARTYLDDYTRKDLPVYGETFSRISKRPYSLIKATEELQKLINIFFYHKELLLAISGTRGTVTDLSQIPSGMSPEEHRYHKKRGSLYIQTVTKGGRKINSSFNQWQQYDETLTPAIQYLDNMIAHTDQMIGYIMGVGHQRMGQVVEGDQVGKTQMAIQQNSLVTEILYYQADQVFGKAFEAALNLATKYCMHEGGIISVEDSVQGNKDVIIKKGYFKDTEFEITLENNTEEETAVHELRSLAVQSYMQGRLPFSNLMGMYRVKELKELELKHKYYEEQAMELARANRDSELANLQQIKEREIQLENEYKKIIEQHRSEIEVMRLAFEKEKLEFEKIKAQAENEMKDKEIRSRMTTEVFKIEKDFAVEQAYLEEQKRQSAVDEELRSIALKVDTMFKQMEMNMEDTKQKYDMFTKNIQLKDRDRPLRKKEHLKD